MPRRAWIIRNGYSGVVNATPKRGKGEPFGFRDLSHAVGQPIGYAPPLTDDLLWGPHHPDLLTQRLMRTAHARSSLFQDNYRAVELCLEALGAGHDLVLWGEMRTGSCLALLWTLAWFVERTDRLDQISLVLDPRKAVHGDDTVEAFLELFDHRLPVAGITTPLLAARLHFASESAEIEADVSGLPSALGDWVALGNHLSDHFPDERGLDRFDDRLLEHLSPDWQRAAWPIGNTLLHTPYYLHPDSSKLWQRLVELSDQQGLQSELEDHPLCEIKVQGQGGMTSAQVRINQLGKNVRSGRSDALKHRRIYRWAGGRLLTNERPLRRTGSYRQKHYRGTLDPQSIPADSGADAG